MQPQLKQLTSELLDASTSTTDIVYEKETESDPVEVTSTHVHKH